MTGIALLGSTGSIGTQTLDVIRKHRDRFRLVTLAGGNHVNEVSAQAHEFQPAVVRSATDNGTRPTANDLVDLALHPDVDIVVIATSGHDAIPATIEALRAGKVVALANKEAIVCAGELIMPMAELGRTLRPIDSEHSAIWQSLQSGRQQDILRILLTASGGPFRNFSRQELEAVTAEQALKHPNFAMGGKITIDSASLMNKGLELIEAHWLFDMPYEAIDIVVHPEQYIHSMVEFADHSVIAQIGMPSMTVPIQFALTWPDHLEADVEPVNWSRAFTMSFDVPDTERFPSLRLARDAGEAGATYPTVLSAADEVAVDAFRRGQIGFLDIPAIIEAALDEHTPSPVTGLEEILEADQWAHDFARQVISSRRS